MTDVLFTDDEIGLAPTAPSGPPSIAEAKRRAFTAGIHPVTGRSLSDRAPGRSCGRCAAARPDGPDRLVCTRSVAGATVGRFWPACDLFTTGERLP